MKISGSTLIRKFQDFLANDDFHNPVTDKNQSLLSTKEKIKGKVLPIIAKTGLLATSLALYSTLSVGGLATLMTLPTALNAVAILALPEIVLRRRYSKAKKDKEIQHFDLNTEDGKKRFSDQYPQKSTNFINNYLTLSREADFSTAPQLFITENESILAQAGISSFGPKKTHYVIMGKKTFDKESSFAICAHEFGHLQKKHYEKNFPLNTLSVANFFVSLSIPASTFFTLAYTAANFMANSFANKKHAQYCEREADRYSLLKTGMTKDLKELLGNHINDTQFNLRLDNKPTLRERFFEAYNGLRSNHPLPIDRYIYANGFDKENSEYCKTVQAKYIRPAKIS